MARNRRLADARQYHHRDGRGRGFTSSSAQPVVARSWATGFIATTIFGAAATGPKRRSRWTAGDPVR